MDQPPQPLVPAARPSRLRRARRCCGRHVWWLLATSIVLVLAAGFVTLQVAGAGRIGGGVTAAGVELGGLTPAEARARLADQLVEPTRVARLVCGEGELSVPLADLGIRIDAAATVAAARERGSRHVAGVSVRLPFGGGEVDPVIVIDRDAFHRGLKEIRAAVAEKPRDARLQLDGGAVTVVPSRGGTALAEDALAAAIQRALRLGQAYRGVVPVEAAAPAVTTADAEARASAAATFLARPISLRLRGRTTALSASAMARLLSVNTGSDAADYPLTFDNARARKELDELFAWAEMPPRDATITVLDRGGITVGESSEGVAVDMDTLVADLDAAAAGEGPRTVVVALAAVSPGLTSEDVRSTGLATLGSQFVTYFDPRNAARAMNIARAAKLVDGAVVRPGAVFSLNATMGPRTTNRGFDFAPVIAADGVLRQGVGGGICQYATTLFNAVYFAGLPIVERHAHSLYISHYPIGRDATVAWGGPDFRFRNDTDKTLTVRSWTQGGALTVALVGQTGREVTTATSDFYDVRLPRHTRSDPRVVYDESLAAGMARWEQGVKGRSVKVMRTVRDAWGKVIARDTFVSEYEPLDWVKRVGPG